MFLGGATTPCAERDFNVAWLLIDMRGRTANSLVANEEAFIGCRRPVVLIEPLAILERLLGNVDAGIDLGGFQV